MERKIENVSASFIKVLASHLLKSRFLLASAIMLLLVSLQSPVLAQVVCIPPPSNYVMPGPPDWLGTINAPIKTELDDPRWDGAASLTWANGTSGDTAKFRALSSGNKLFLSWIVELPPQSPQEANVVYVGFTQVGGATPTNFAIAIKLNTLTPGSDKPDYSPSLWSVDNSGVPTSIPSPYPSWINNTRVWITNSNFAVQMVVPISSAGINSGLNLGTDFKMWFEMQEALPPATPATVWAAVFPDGRGGTPIAADVTAPFAIQYPAPNTWASFHLSSGPGDSACTLGGISITGSQIGTLNVNPTTGLPAPHTIQFAKTGTNSIVNTFFAAPTNGMTTAIPAGGVTATFRIADWGSTYDPNAPWTTIPNGQDIASTAIINAGTTAGKNNINFNWTVQDTATNNWLTDFRAGKEPDQCMLVELAGGTLTTWQANHSYSLNATVVDPKGNLQKVTTAGISGLLQPAFSSTPGGMTIDNTVTWMNSGPAIGPGLTFLNNSVLTNMMFVGVSEYKHKAAINIQNLPALSSSPRDVYLYILTNYMQSATDPGWKKRYNDLFGPPEKRTGEKTRAVLNRMPAAQLDQIVPSYRVFVFHDSGKKIKINNQDFLILHPQSGFGYYALPHEDVTGWTHSLKGATEIAPDYYRISIPNDGIGHVETSITAIGTPITPPRRFAVFADVGVGIPHDPFSNVVKTGVSFNAGVEGIINPHFSVEGIFGVHYFPGKTTGSSTVTQFGGGVKAFLNPGHPNLFFVRAGTAGYHFNSGPTEFGGYVGAGLLHNFNPHFGLEGVYTFHTINTTGTVTKFSTVQGGIRYAF
jgi:hypothetical protein